MFVRKKRSLYLITVLLIFILTLYFSVSAVTGKRGLLTLINLKKDIEYNESLLKGIFYEKNKLNNKILGLYEKSLDLDLLDEQVKNLGYAHPNELMVIIDRE